MTFGLDLAVSAAAETLPVTGGGAFPLDVMLVALGGLAMAGGLGAEGLRRRWR